MFKWMDQYVKIQRRMTPLITSWRLGVLSIPGACSEPFLLSWLSMLSLQLQSCLAGEYDAELLLLAESRLRIVLRDVIRREWEGRSYEVRGYQGPQGVVAMPDVSLRLDVESFASTWGENPFAGKRPAMRLIRALNERFGWSLDTPLTFDDDAHKIYLDHIVHILMARYEGYQCYIPKSSEREIVAYLVFLLEGGHVDFVRAFMAYEILTPRYTPAALTSALRVTYTLRHEIPTWDLVKGVAAERLGAEAFDYLQGL